MFLKICFIINEYSQIIRIYEDDYFCGYFFSNGFISYNKYSDIYNFLCENPLYEPNTAVFEEWLQDDSYYEIYRGFSDDDDEDEDRCSDEDPNRTCYVRSQIFPDMQYCGPVNEHEYYSSKRKKFEEDQEEQKGEILEKIEYLQDKVMQIYPQDSDDRIENLKSFQYFDDELYEQAKNIYNYIKEMKLKVNNIPV